MTDSLPNDERLAEIIKTIAETQEPVGREFEDELIKKLYDLIGKHE